MPTNTTNMQTFAAADGLKLAYYVDDFTDPSGRPTCCSWLHAAMGSVQIVRRKSRADRVRQHLSADAQSHRPLRIVQD